MRIRTPLLASLMLLLFAGVALSADRYEIDVVHSHVGFSIRHLVISNIKGHFNDFSGTIDYDENDNTKSSVKVTIKTASIDTDNEDRDAHLKSADFFSVEEYPEITFQSTGVKKTDDGLVLNGKLTLHGVTKETAIPFEMLGKAKDPRGKQRIAFEGYTKLDRKDFGITWNKTMDAGGLVVGNEVKIELQIEAIKK